MDTLISPRRRSVLQALAAAALLGACGERSRGAPAPAEFRGATMGSIYTLKIAGTGLPPATLATARHAVADALSAVDRAMSTHRTDSELSRFNAHAATTPFALSAATFAVFAEALLVSAETNGAFDITVAPMVDAWGFGPGRRQRLVTEREVAAMRQRVGWALLHLDHRAGTIEKARPDVRADLSGIAKGYGVDRAAAALDALGVGDYMIEAGGEVRTRGHNAEAQPWRIGIEQPDAVPQRPRYIVPLSGRSIATSGDYRIYFERDGRRYCHEIDPATGRPMRNALASVSVVADRCSYADALGKLIVLGPEGAYAHAAAHRLAAYFVVRESGGALRDMVTPAFAALGGQAVPA